MYHKMFLLFQYHREAFDLHYGQRAQVESTFGAFKQKFGETLASRKFDSQVNEVLCMAIAFNVTMVVRQMFGAGIFPEFLRPPPSKATPVGAQLAPTTTLRGDLSPNRELAEPAVTLSAPPK